MLRGVDFAVTIPEGRSVYVDVRGAFLLEDAGPAAAPAWQRADVSEDVLGPSDGVEVTGVLCRDADPAGETTSGRATPLRLTIRSGPGVPLVIRRLT